MFEWGECEGHAEPARRLDTGAMNGPTIDLMQAADWPDVRVIYEEGIATGLATFERSAPSWDAWDRSHRRECRLVARDGDDVGCGVGGLEPLLGARRLRRRGRAQCVRSRTRAGSW